MEKEKKESKKLTYEELEKVAHQLSEQAQKLYQQLQDTQLQNLFTRLSFLIEVVKLPTAFSKEFYDRCVKEVEQLLTIPENKETNETPAEDKEEKWGAGAPIDVNDLQNTEVD